MTSISEETESISRQAKAVVFWFTGLSGAGKSTISEAVSVEMSKLGIQNYVLDGDKIRRGLCSDLGFSHDDRTENIRRIGEVAKLLCDAGVVTLVAFISPYMADRDNVRGILDKGKFVEIFVDCPLEVCEQRDVKGLYQKARKGEIANFTGISDPYEVPANPEIHLRTDQSDVSDCVKKIIKYYLHQ
ncbi:MAG: adenylyl-sulfate kinase [Candidatus Omnitrophica bacterium]|nr:adenylyl-sulfate kinase [Candidatus Omnitrophota bacterium]